MSKLKKVYFPFNSIDLNHAEDFLHEMASKGWFLKSMSHYYFLTFEKGEPKECFYSIDITKKQAFFLNGYPSKEAWEYIEYCESAGWNFVCAQNIFLIFTSSSKDKVIPTMPIEEKIEVIESVLNKQNKWLTPILILCYIYFIYYFIFETSDSRYGSYSVFMIFASLLFIFVFIEKTLIYFDKKKRLEQNLPIQQITKENFFMRMRMSKIIFPILIIFRLLTVFYVPVVIPKLIIWLIGFPLCIGSLYLIEKKNLNDFYNIFYFVTYGSIASFAVTCLIGNLILLLF